MLSPHSIILRHHRGLEKLSLRKIERLTKPGKYSDGGGLYLQISPRGTKSWLFRRVRRGVEHSLGLGPLSRVSLEDAREEASEIRAKLAQGEELRQIRTKTFDQCLAGYLVSRVLPAGEVVPHIQDNNVVSKIQHVKQMQKRQTNLLLHILRGYGIMPP